MSLSDRKKVSFEFVSDVTKQVTAVAAALVGLSITFRQELLKGHVDTPPLLLAAVALYMVTVVLGLWVLLALTGALGREPAKGARPWYPPPPPAPRSQSAQRGQRGIADDDLTIYRASIRLPSGLQLLAFGAAVVCTFLFGWTRVGAPAPLPSPHGYPYAREQLRSGTRCMLTSGSDAEAVLCARRHADLAFRYTPPPAEAAGVLATISAIADSARRCPKRRRIPSADRLRFVMAYWRLDSLIEKIRYDTVAASAAR